MTSAPRRVLILEDDEANALLQKRSLERTGLSVSVAHTAERALGALLESPPDIIVVDHQLRADYTGIAFCATLRASGSRIPVVMVSASNDQRIVVDALRAGVKDFVLKDSRFFEALPAAIARVLERTQVEAQVSGMDIVRPEARSGIILVVEDEEPEAQRQIKELKRTGHSVVAANSLQSVLTVVQNTTVELLVIDQRLANDQTGLHVYLTVQAAGYDIPAVLVTGFSDRETAAEALRAGVREYIEKNPGYERQLPSVVQRVLERVYLERQLTESRTRLASIISSARDAILTVSGAGTITLLNRAAADLFGVAAADGLGKPVAEFLPGLRALAKGAEGAEVSLIEMEGRRSDGTVCPLEVSISATEIAGGRFHTIIARDITSRKRAEAQLRVTNEALARANDDLQQFAYISSHDLQEPIRTVTAYTQMLQRRLAGTLDNESQTYMEYVVSSARRMSDLISDALQYARISSEPPELSHVSVVAVVDHVLADCDALIAETGATITHDPLPEVYAERAHLEIVFRNLITNAIKYRGERPPTIHISAERCENEWRFAVRDNGIGFDPKYRDQIFRVFKRLHGGTVGGTGIGLALCKRITENHGGSIWATSAIGQGSTFYFTIPAEQRAPMQMTGSQ